MSASAQSLRAGFSAARPSFEGESRTVTEDGRTYRGRFVELLGAASAFDGVETRSLAEHLRARGLDDVSVAPVELNAAGALLVTQLVAAHHEVALAVDRDATGWGVDLRGLHSPGTLATRIVQRAGVRAPKVTCAQLTDTQLQAWTATLHGGLVDAHPTGGLVPVADLDVRSAYPRVAHLLDAWQLLTAGHVHEEDVTAPFRAFLAGQHLAETLRDPATWRQWGCTRVVVRATGQPLPVELHVGGRAGRLCITGVHADGWDTTWCDAAAATLLAGRPVDVLEARRVVPVGRVDLEPVRTPLLDIDPGTDPFLAMLTARRDVKQRLARARSPHQRRQLFHHAALLRLFGNAFIGQLGRFQPDGAAGERPGPWCCPPVEACVWAGARLLVLMLGRDVERAGGIVLATDTDGSLVAASPDGGEHIVTLDGRDGVALSWSTLDTITAAYARLAPDDPGGLWSTQHATANGAPLVGRVFGPKRWTFGHFDTVGGFVADEATEHVIGVYEPPPTMTGVRPNGRADWTADVARTLATHDFARGGVVERFGWEHGPALGFPALTRNRWSSVTDASANAVAKVLGLRPFGRWVEATAESHRSERPVAPDPGSDLSDWRDLAWVDAHTGAPVRIDPTGADPLAVPVHSLLSVAVQWARPRPRDVPDVVHVDPALVRHVGGLGAAVYRDDAAQPVVRDVDHATVLGQIARRIGPQRLHDRVPAIRLRTAEGIASGARRPSGTTVERALAATGGNLGVLLDEADARRCQSCWEPLGARQRRWCSERCKKRVQRAQRRRVELPSARAVRRKRDAQRKWRARDPGAAAPTRAVRRTAVGVGTDADTPFAYPPCPRCGKPMETTWQPACDDCRERDLAEQFEAQGSSW